MTALLQIDNLGKRFGGFVALENISLSVAAGERLGLIGPNGSGKSTLVNCICGTLRNEQGAVRFDGRKLDGLEAHQRTRLGLARSFQLPRPFASLSLADNIRIPLLYTVAARGTIHSAREVDERCHHLLGEVGLEAKARRLPRDLTQVEMRKLELARAMAAQPKLLIADEAMAGLTHSEIEEILTLLVPLERSGRHHHSHRAHHARGDELLAPAGRAGFRQENRRRRAGRRHARSGSGKGLPWLAASPSPVSMPPMARCA